jgi:hypothetical protein
LLTVNKNTKTPYTAGIKSHHLVQSQTTGTSIGPGKKKYDQIDKITYVHLKSVKNQKKRVNNEPL